MNIPPIRAPEDPNAPPPDPEYVRQVQASFARIHAKYHAEFEQARQRSFWYRLGQRLKKHKPRALTAWWCDRWR